MITVIRSQVAGERLAFSAQPPRVSSFFSHTPSSLRGPQPVPSTFFLDNPGALLEGLRCFPASPPLPGPERPREKPCNHLCLAKETHR
jgi:hypothetical protein